MIALHGGVLEGQFLLWGEAPADGALPATEARGPAARRRGRRKAEGNAKPYPFDAGHDRLRQALQAAGVTWKPRAADVRPCLVWLPTSSGRPIPSSPLIAQEPARRGQPALAPWPVSAIYLPMAAAVDFLCVGGGRSTLAPGIVVGPDVAFWSEALRFAGSVVGRQQYLPGVREKHGDYRATWDAVPTVADADRVAGIAQRMPPAARALTPTDATEPPATPAAQVLSTFLNTCVDHLVRSGSVVQPAVPRRTVRKKGPAFESVHDQWLAALRSPDGRMAADGHDLAALAEAVAAWRRPMTVSAASPWRLCFRLEEPAQEAMRDGAEPTAGVHGPWRVRYLLQRRDDLSLLVPVEQVWGARGRRGRKRAVVGDGREYVLSALGQAAGLCPPVEASLKTAAPAGCVLDATGAHTFLTDWAGALEQGGFRVLLPAWWTRTGTKERLRLKAHVKSPRAASAGGLSLEDLVQVDWEVALGDERLSLADLERLARLKQPLVNLRGQWVEVNAAEIQAALAFWRKKTGSALPAQEVLRLALGAETAPGGLEFSGVTATGWVGDWLERLTDHGVLEELEAPAAFVGTLRPYQVRGYSWLAFLRQWGLGACLADDMGLGKTIQTLALIRRDWEHDGRRPVLIVCPTSVVRNWEKEAARFTPDLPVMVHHGIGRRKGKAFESEAQRHAVVVSSYSLLHRDLEHLQAVRWAGVILDEAQNIKNPETKQARAARSLPADYRIGLTGTPVENTVGDLWSIMEFLNPGLLGSQAAFKRGFQVPIQVFGNPDAAARLKRLTGPFILRRLKTDRAIIADLPDKLEMRVFCTLTKEQASLYQAVLKDLEPGLETAEGIERKGIVLAALSKLKQVCNHPAQFLGDRSSLPGRSGKLARLTEMLEEVMEVADRALIFTQFAEMGDLLRRHLQETFGKEVLFLHGGVPRGQRDRMVERFQAEDGPPLFILSLKAGGTGLNLTRANHVFHFDRWWNPAVEQQATDRAFRIGQTRNVQVHTFVCAGTLEERIDEMIERKKALAESVLGTGEAWLTNLSNAELREVLALRREALAE